MANSCFVKCCKLEVQYVCQCLSFITYCCEFHLQPHLKLRNRAHSFDSILTEPIELTKDAILKFLVKEKAKKEKLKKIAKASLNKDWNNFENNIKCRLNDINSELKEINWLIAKISQAPEKDPLNSLISDHDNDITKTSLPNDSEEYTRLVLYLKLGQLRNNRFKILHRASNDQETEQNFRRNCLSYKNHASDSLFGKAYQEYISEYEKLTSTYLIDYENLCIYNTETEKEEVKASNIPEVYKFDSSLIQLPNGELFFIGRNDYFSIFYILDKNYGIRNLPLQVPRKCFGAIYFSKSIYCFGINVSNHLNSSWKFNLEENRWSDLALVKENMYCYCNSVVFNKNILISMENRNILLYSIDIDSFSKIPYSFPVRSKKILINAGERLYMIVCNRWIYESDIESEYHWKKIAKSIIESDPEQVYCTYNKEGIYISIFGYNCREYFKFDLNRKALVEIAFYSKNIGLKRLDDKLEVISSYDQTFKLNPFHAKANVDRGYSLSYIGKNLDEIEELNKQIKRYQDKLDVYDCAWALIHKGEILWDIENHFEAIECYNEAAKIDPYNPDVYDHKGNALQKLGRHHEAIECYNEATRFQPIVGYIYDNTYINKGISLHELGKDLEAIECYNEAIELKSDNAWGYFNKGIALQKLTRNLEAIACYNKVIKLNHNDSDAYNNKGTALMDLYQCEEAIECFNEAIKLKPKDAIAYNNKGETLYNLDRYIEAIESYDKAIKLKIDDPRFYYNRANAFKKLGKHTEAYEDFNRAAELMKNHQAKE